MFVCLITAFAQTGTLSESARSAISAVVIDISTALLGLMHRTMAHLAG